MLWSFSILILVQALGELAHALIGWQVPSTITGVCLLLLGLWAYARWSGKTPELPAADGLLSYLALFFVAPGVSAVMHADQLARAWPAVAAGLVGSTVLALGVTGRVTQALLSREKLADQLAQSSPAARIPS